MYNNNFIKFLIIICFANLLIFYYLKHIPKELLGFSWNNQTAASAFVSIIIILSMFYKLVGNKGIKTLVSKLGQLIFWGVFFLLIIIGYAFKAEVQYVSNRVLAVLIPSHSWVSSEGQLIIARSQDGHFYLNLVINGIPIKFVIDTGATDVAITKKDAQALKIDLSKLKFSRAYRTANGVSFAAPIKLPKVQIGPQIFENIDAHVASGDLDISLLGMSLIERFRSFKIDKDLLTLSY